MNESSTGVIKQHPNEDMHFPGGSRGKEAACQCRRQIRDMGSISGSGRSLEKEMAPYSGILAWRIPWTEEPRGLQCMGLKRVGHD